MKTDKRRTFLTAFLLSLIAGAGCIGCLTTGFSLSLHHIQLLAALLCLWSLTCCMFLSMRKGGLLVLCALGMVTGFYFHSVSGRNETLSLIMTIAERYDDAYHWGVLRIPLDFTRQNVFDWPLTVTAIWMQAAVCKTVFSRRGTTAACLLMAVPLVLCMVVTNTIPHVLPLAGVLLVMVLLVLTDNVRLDSISQAGRLILLGALPGILALALLFALVPQEGYVNHAKENQEKLISLLEKLPQELRERNMSVALPSRRMPSVDLASLNGQPQLGIPVLEVTSEAGGEIYLREQDFDEYTGRGWKVNAWRQEAFGGDRNPADRITIRTETEMENRLMVYYPEWGTMLANGRTENAAHALEYTLTSYGPESCPFPQDRFLELPRETSRRAAELLKKIPGDFSSADAAAATVAAFVRQAAAYDRMTGAMPAGESDFAMWFLESSDTGYCAHFATASAVLLRSLGVPARYVTGFKVNAVAGEPVAVTSDDAHAWTEYFDYTDSHWKVLDATPGAAEPTASDVPGLTPAATGSEQSSETVPGAAGERETAPSAPVKQPAPKRSRIPGILLGAAAVMLGLEVQRFLRRQLRRRKQRRGSLNSQVAGWWQETELMAKLLEEEPPEELREYVEKAWFSAHPLSLEELKAFAVYCRASRRKLEEHPLWRRVIERYYYSAL